MTPREERPQARAIPMNACPRCGFPSVATALPSFRECRHCHVIYSITPGLEYIRRQIEREIAIDEDWRGLRRGVTNAIAIMIGGATIVVLLTAWWTA